MARKLLVMAIVLVIVCITSITIYAGGDDIDTNQAVKEELQKIEKEVEIREPSQDSIKAEEDIVLITIKGKKGTNVTLDVYLNSKVSTKQEFDSLDSVNEEDYQLILSEDIEISLTGTGTYSKEIELSKGLYKIVVTRNDGDVIASDTRYILCIGINDAAEVLDNAKNSLLTPFIDTIKNLSVIK